MDQKFLTKNTHKVKEAYETYIECKLEQSSIFSLKDFFQFYQENHVEVFIKYNGIAILRLIHDEAELYFFGIKSSHKNLGYGKKMLENIIEHYEKLGAKTIFLEVDKQNLIAIKLYSKLGFLKYGTRKDYYKNKLEKLSDAILMKLQLSL